MIEMPHPCWPFVAWLDQHSILDFLKVYQDPLKFAEFRKTCGYPEQAFSFAEYHSVPLSQLRRQLRKSESRQEMVQTVQGFGLPAIILGKGNAFVGPVPDSVKESGCSDIFHLGDKVIPIDYEHDGVTIPCLFVGMDDLHAVLVPRDLLELDDMSEFRGLKEDVENG